MPDLVRLLTEGRAWGDLLPAASSAVPAGRPGGIVALSHAGRTAMLAVGLADLEHNVPITRDTVFDCASVAKQLTAAAILQHRAGGAIGLDDDLLEHIPELGATYTDVKLRHLLFHTSGIRDYQQLLALAGARRNDYFRAADVLGLLGRQQSLLHRCGTRHVYSNSNYFLLAQVIERTSRHGFVDFLGESVLEPAGLRHTRVRDDLATLVAGRARSYVQPDGQDYRHEHTPTDVVGDSGLLSTVDDLLTWARYLRSELKRDGSPLAAMRSPGTLDDGSTLAYGYGLYHRQWNGTPGFGHGGSFDGFRSELVVLPERELEAVVLCNWPADAARVAAVLLEHTCALLDAPARMAAAPGPTWPRVLVDESGLAWELRPGREAQFVLLSTEAQVVLRVDDPGRLVGEWEQRQVSVSRGAGEFVIAVGSRAKRAQPDSSEPLTETRLSGLAGRYWSDELMTAAAVSVEDTKLRWRRRSAAESLDWITGDVFRAGGTWVTFRRENGVAAELEVSTPRASGIIFRRQG